MANTAEAWLGKDNQLGLDIWNKKYRVDNETFDEWLDRVSAGDKKIRELILQKKFLFGGRILAGRGIDDENHKVSLSNCYVIDPPEDNIESIFEASGKLARTYSYGGGCGIDLGKLAPKGSRVRNAAKESSGALSFLNVYELTTQVICQKGRRGALMISMPVNHPDIEDFIELKTDLKKATKANLSIRVDEGFMKAVKENRLYELSFIREETGEIIKKLVDARKLFHRLAETNWDYGEPGMLFWDEIENWNLLSEHDDFRYAGVNPCAEEPLPAGGSCLLGAINLAEFVNDPFTDHAVFDSKGFLECVDIGIRALNDVLMEGLPKHPLKEQRDSVDKWRQIGLGLMGYADMLIKMGIRYGSEKAINFTDQFMEAMMSQAILSSILLAKEKGKCPGVSPKKIAKSQIFQAHQTRMDILLRTYPSMQERLDEEDRKQGITPVGLLKKYGIANSQLLCIAPTGTISTMLGVSGGMEPIFATQYRRKTETLHDKDEYYMVNTKIVQDLMDAQDITDIKDLPLYVITAPDIFYKNRIATQAAFQRHIDASISSTLNVPHSMTVEDVENVYLEAWKAHLKGITLFRDGCRRAGILNSHVEEKKENEVPDIGRKRNLVTGCGTLHVTAWFYGDTGELREIFLNKGSTGGCNNFMNSLSRMISLKAQEGAAIERIVDKLEDMRAEGNTSIEELAGELDALKAHGSTSIERIIDQLDSTGVCPSYAVRRATKGDTSKGSCCPMAVGNALREMHAEVMAELGQKSQVTEKKPVNKSVCPSCGSPLIFEGGCNICKNCGWSKCD